ncbi:MAG: hypothetical protein JST79_16335 [Acidobacteria bacterium]|nr:hypothetical protein [Acidobacteriota bacterium]
MSDPSGTSTYSYDSHDHLTSKQTPEGTLRRVAHIFPGVASQEEHTITI